MKTRFSFDRPSLVIGAIVLVNVALLVALYRPPAANRTTASGDAYPEVAELAARQQALTFPELSKYFTRLAEQKGAAYAFGVLKVTPLPPNIDLHLLGHVVGDILYKQQGAKGMRICTQDFRNACSHSIVVGFLLEHGEGALDELASICREAPGGSGAYTMCFHGLGHGMLAYAGYEMPKAIDLCRKASPNETGREFIECVGGTVMEIVGGGFHNRALWEKKTKIYTPVSDPLLPCSADYMPAIARGQCYIYLTPRLFKAAGGNLGHLTEEDYRQAFLFCDQILATDTRNRLACYSGFGKEFIVLARARDIRRMDEMTEAEAQNVLNWCSLAPNAQAIEACMQSAVNSLYWGGENHPRAAILLCSLTTGDALRNSCFNTLFGAVTYYTGDAGRRREVCALVPHDQTDICQTKLAAP